MKRSDIPTLEVLAGVAQRNLCENLFGRFPHKLVLAALERDCRRGLIDYGTTLRSAWVTPKGKTYTEVA